MKTGKVIKVLSIVMLSAFVVSTMALAQQDTGKKKPAVSQNEDGTYSSTEHNEANRPEDSYLAKFHAHDVVEKLMKKNLEQIYLLKVVVTNFKGKDGWEKSYNECYQGYKKAMKYFYERNMIYARVEFEKNKKQISDLLEKIIAEYKKEANEMLSLCVDRIMELHLMEETRSDPNKNRELFHNQMRLRISYAQMDEARASRIAKNPEVALYHYRVAKVYAIKIIEALSEPKDADKNKQKYDVHKADNLNRILKKSSGGGGNTAPTQ